MLWFVFGFFLILRLVPYVFSSVPLGYDPGLYLYAFKKYAQISFLQYQTLGGLTSQSEIGLPILVKILTSFKLNPEKLLIPLIICFSALLFYSVYLLAKKLWDQKAALWTIFLLTVSALQYRAYWYYYIKNIAALSFLSFTAYFLLQTSYMAIPFAILTFYFHRPTSVFLAVILLTGLLFEKKKRKFYSIVTSISLMAAAPYYLLTFKETILPLVKPILTVAGNGSSGTFYNLLPALGLSLIYLPLAFWGIFKQGKEKKIILTPLILSLIIVIFKFFFNRRIIIFADFFLLFFAGWTASKIFSHERVKRFRFLKLAYPILGIVFISIFVWKTAKPLIFKDELGEIRMLSETENNAYVLVTDLEYTPWVYGWSDRKVIAPGFGDDYLYWSIPEWHQFWESNSREKEKELLLKLPKPLYLYHGNRSHLIYTNFETPCFERINWRTYKFICEK